MTSKAVVEMRLISLIIRRCFPPVPVSVSGLTTSGFFPGYPFNQIHLSLYVLILGGYPVILQMTVEIVLPSYVRIKSKPVGGP